MHDLMVSFEESKKFRIVAEEANGAFHDLKMFSEDGLHFEQIDWQEEFGKHGSVGDVILSLMEIAEERAGKKNN